MVNLLIKLSDQLDRLGLHCESDKVDSLIKSSGSNAGPWQQLMPFEEGEEVSLSRGGPATSHDDIVRKYKKHIDGYMYDSNGTKKIVPPNPLKLLNSNWKGQWYDEQLSVYNELKDYAVQVLLSKESKLMLGGVGFEPIVYFKIKNPQGENLYKDNDLSKYEDVAAELSAKHNPYQFLESFYLTNKYPDLMDSAKISIMENQGEEKAMDVERYLEREYGESEEDELDFGTEDSS